MEKAERKRMADSGFTALYCMRHPDWLMQILVGKYTHVIEGELLLRKSKV